MGTCAASTLFAAAFQWLPFEIVQQALVLLPTDVAPGVAAPHYLPSVFGGTASGGWR